MTQQSHQAGITRFGTTGRGEAVERIVLSDGRLRVALITLGATLQGLWLPGGDHSLTPGSDRLADYEGPLRHHGSLIGPVVNRLSGAQAPLDGRPLRFEANQDGRLTLHSGAAGTHLKVWRLGEMSETSATLMLDLPDGEGGFPGNRHVSARYSLPGGDVLRLEVEGRTDAPTLMNFANHSYWNLDGTACWQGHRLRIAADRWLPTDGDFCPDGRILPVAGGPMDFRTARAIAPQDPALDNCFCLADGRGPLREALELTSPGGRRMTVLTTEAGVQVYDGRDAARPGHAPYEGIAVETQGWPDAPNRPGFPSIDLRPGEGYRSVTEWRFALPDA